MIGGQAWPLVAACSNATPHRDCTPDPPLGKPNLVLPLSWLLVPQVLQAASCSGSAGDPNYSGIPAVGVDWLCG